MEPRSTNMSSLSCGTLYSTSVYLHLLYFYVFRIPTLSSGRFWGFGGGVIPVLIPNTAVKPPSGDGTHRFRWGEELTARTEHPKQNCPTKSGTVLLYFNVCVKRSLKKYIGRPSF